MTTFQPDLPRPVSARAAPVTKGLGVAGTQGAGAAGTNGIGALAARGAGLRGRNGIVLGIFLAERCVMAVPVGER